MQLPDKGADPVADRDAARRRRATIAGMMTSPSGALGTANTSATSSTLG
ncbi:hypothetical protein [Sphingobium sp. YR657]